MNEEIIKKFTGDGYSYVKEIANKNVRDGASYFVLSKKDQKYLLKIKNLSDGNSFVYDEKIQEEYVGFGYPEVSKIFTVNNKLVSLTNYYDGIVVSEKAYTWLTPALYPKIESFLTIYLDFLVQNVGNNSYDSRNHSDYLNKHLDKYDAHIRERFGAKFSPTISLIEDGINKNNQLFSNSIVIQHGDCYGSNMVVDSSGKIILIDWDSIQAATVFYDLAIFISKHALDKNLITTIYNRAKNLCDQNISSDLLNLTILFVLMKQLSDIADLKDELYESELFTSYRISLLDIIELFFQEYAFDKAN